MPVYLLTLHAYRSWSPADRRGYVRHGEMRIRPSDPAMAAKYDARATEEPTRFEREVQPIVIEAARDACMRRGWRLHGVAVTATHVHALVSWREGATWKQAADTLKRVIGFKLAKAVGPEGKRWFSRGHSRKRVTDVQHVSHLLTSYLPKHKGEGGSVWCESGG